MWQKGNLNRLKRSIDKLTEEKDMQNINYKWQLLKRAYRKNLHE